MSSFLPTIILRHRKENLKKCSLRGLEHNKNIKFFSYPTQLDLPINGYVSLDLEAKPLSIKDREKGLFLIDATWNYASVMTRQIDTRYHLEKRSLPKDFVTAYPRKQTGCSSPDRGLASVEALYIAHKILNLPTTNLLDNYYWKDLFLSLNKESLDKIV